MKFGKDYEKHSVIQKMMLSRRLQQLKNFDLNRKDPEKIITGISNLVNVMREVVLFAEKYKVEEHLYYGESMARINHLIGDRRSTKFISETCEEDLSPISRHYQFSYQRKKSQ